MNVKILALGIGVAALALGAVGLRSGGGTVRAAGETPAGRLVVSGQATVQASPDLAQITFEVRSQEGTAVAAASDNATALGNLRRALEGLGLGAADIQTSWYNLNPTWAPQSDPGSDRPSGYQASTTVQVMVRKLDDVGAVVDAAVASGANGVDGIQYQVSDPTKYQQEALKEALTDARQHAQVMAATESGTLGAVLRAEEGGDSRPVPIYNAPLMALASAPAVPSFSPGPLTFTASAQVTYAMTD